VLACYEKSWLTDTDAGLPWVRAENQRSPELLLLFSTVYGVRPLDVVYFLARHLLAAPLA
jgi:hypothetical protein